MNTLYDGLIMLRALFIYSVFIVTASGAYAGAWTQKQEAYYISAAIATYQSDAFIDLQGDKQAQPTFLKYELNLYGEYGWNDDLTIGANLFLQYLTQESANAATSDPDNMGIGDSELFARYRFWHGDSYVLSLQPLIKLPSYYKEDQLPQGGSDTFDIELSILYGQGFTLFGNDHYLDTRLGYRHRTDDMLNDQLKADIKFGLNISENWQLIPAVSYTQSTSLPSTAIFTQSGQNDYDLLKVESSLLYKLDKSMNLYATAFAHVAGRNTGHGAGMILGTGLQF